MPRQPSFPNTSRNFFFLDSIFFPHLIVILLPIILLSFWLFFFSLFHTLPLHLLQLFISLFNFSSHHLLFYLILLLLFFQPFSSLFDFSSPYYFTFYCYNSSNPSSPLLTLLLPIFISINLLLFLLHISLPFSLCPFYKKIKKKVIILLLYYNGFLFLLISYNFTLSLWVFVFFIALIWIDGFWIGVMFLNSLSHILSPLMVLPFA